MRSFLLLVPLLVLAIMAGWHNGRLNHQIASTGVSADKAQTQVQSPATAGDIVQTPVSVIGFGEGIGVGFKVHRIAPVEYKGSYTRYIINMMAHASGKGKKTT